FGIEPVLHRITPLDPGIDFVIAQMPALARIERRAIRVGARRLGGDLAPRAEAGVKQAALMQLLGGILVDGEPRRLPHHRLFPFEAEPTQVLEDRLGEFRLATNYVDILDADEKASAEPFGPVGG